MRHGCHNGNNKLCYTYHQTKSYEEVSMVNSYRFGGKLNFIGDIIEEARLRKGLTREELAQQIRNYHIPMKRETIFRIERGERRILDYELVLLKKLLELDNNEAENQIYQHFQDIHNQKTINNA